MKRIFIILFISVLAIGLIMFRLNTVKKRAAVPNQHQNLPEAAKTDGSQPVPNNAKITQDNSLAFPIDRASERVTKKPFGIYITPQNSPVQPERFAGYHTGTDFETFPEEQNSDVPIYAITSGKIVLKKLASGYGGILVENAEINGNPVTIIYGHLNLGSTNKKNGDSLDAGEQIGILGKGYSQETDGERKHLHLGIHRGVLVNIRGYVNTKADLGSWIDPAEILNF